MHPAYSVIVFTVSSGAGLGLLGLLGLGPLFGAPPIGAAAWIGFALAFGLTIGGLGASTLHLGHPERAWRAFSQWRSSWLSREGVAAVATLFVAALYAAGALFGGGASPLLGGLTALGAAATVLATAMIYAQLKTVPRWNSHWTVICYGAFSLAGGLLLYLLALAISGAGAPGGLGLLTMLALLCAWAAKIQAWRRGDASGGATTPETATGLGHMGRVRLFEAPHSGENYLLKEMGHRVARRHRDKLRRLALALGGAAPIVAVALSGAAPGPALWLGLGVVAHGLGMLTERWLFFAEAEHVMMRYYLSERADPAA